MISLFIIGFLLLATSWNLYYAFHWNRNLSVSLNFIQNCVYAGGQAEMTEQIENHKRLALPVLEVAFHIDKRLFFRDCENTRTSDFIYKRDIFALLGFQRITRKLALDCPNRGYYRIDCADLTTFSMLHKRRFSIEYPAKAELYVYAAQVNIADILTVCQRLMGNLQCAKRLYEDPFAFSSIREYTVTDPMNTVNWKASARTSELMVNTFESTLTQRIMIYLDVEDSGILKYEYLIEDSISVAASLARKLIGHGLEVGICINASHDMDWPDNGKPSTERRKTPPRITYIKPSCSKKQLTTIEQMLAKYRNDKTTLPLAKLLTEYSDIQSPSHIPAYAESFPFMPSEDTIMIFISKNAIPNQTAIQKFVGKDRQAAWVIPYTRNETCDVKASDHIQIIRREVDAS